MVVGELTAETVLEEEEEEAAPPPVVVKVIEPEKGTLEWIQYCSIAEGHLPTPINVSITGSTPYSCPELKWYNFDVFPHKVKLSNTGYTLVLGAKWKAERPYLEGGPLFEKHILSQVHFHWGASMLEGSDHAVDRTKHPGEMQVSFFRKEYMTQEEALKHPDGVLMVCYIIKHGVNPDSRLSWVIEGFPRIQEAQTHTRIGPCPMCDLMPMFFEDYFLYWGSLTTVRGDSHVVRWLVPRVTLFATMDQMKQFRKLWDPWDDPNLRNFRPLKEAEGRHVFFISPHWAKYNSLLPIPRVPEPSISVLSPSYQNHLYLLPPQNSYMLPEEKLPEEEIHEDNSSY